MIFNYFLVKGVKDIVNLKKICLGLTSGVAIFLLLARTVFASGQFELFGESTIVDFFEDPSVRMISDVQNDPNYGGIEFKIADDLTFGNIKNLQATYLFLHGSCGGGSPRFQIKMGGKNAFVYLGSPPNYTECPRNEWIDSNNLATVSAFIDTSQLGGTFYDTFESAWNKYGDKKVESITLVTDGGWKFTQNVAVKSVTINEETFSFGEQEEQTSAHPSPSHNQSAE